MKLKLHWWCRIFGHKFVGNYQWLEGDKSITERKPSSFCVNCGLSKEERKCGFPIHPRMGWSCAEVEPCKQHAGWKAVKSVTTTASVSDKGWEKLNNIIKK